MASNGKSSDGNLSSSLTDLMTSLMVIFVLLLVATLNNMSVEGENTRNDILKDVRSALKSDLAVEKIEAKEDKEDPLGIIIIVPENLFGFETGKSDVPLGGVKFLQKFVPILVSLACDKYKDKINSIVVEGHADSRGSDELNLRLSQERAMSVAQKILETPELQNESRKKRFLKLLSANGRGKWEPFLDEYNNEDQERSRRVVFKVKIRSSEQMRNS